MFESLGRALSSVFGHDRPAGKAAPGRKPTAREQALAQIRQNQERVMTPERAALIQKAMEVRRAKQKILMDLDDEQRQKLAVMAMRAFLNEGKDDKK